MSGTSDRSGRCVRSTFVALIVVFGAWFSASEAAAQVACPATPSIGCRASLRGKVLIHDDPKYDSKNKFLWSFIQGEAMNVAELGNPITTDAYSVCVYDGIGGAPGLVMELQALSGALWRAQANNGFGYRDRTRASDGLQLIRVAAGSAGRSKVKVTARGENIPIPAPYSVGVQLMETNPSVIVQMHNTTGTCWSNEFEVPAIRNNGKDYRGAY